MSVSQIDKVVAYVRSQPEHHKKMTFDEEFLAQLKRLVPSPAGLG